MRFVIKCYGLIAALSLPVLADMFNHKIVLVGDKAAALGGAFTGLADDATATYYNPAGLTQIKNIKLNVSAQVVQFQKQQIGIAPGTKIPYNSFNFSPTITAFSQRMGNWAYGFSIATPENDLFTGEQKIQASYRDTLPNQPCYELPENRLPCYSKLNLSYYDVPKVTLIGPSGAMKYSENISLGFTLYGIYFTELEKTAYGGWDANFFDPGSDSLARFHESNVNRSVNQSGLGITGMFGILVRMNQGFSFGINASPGSQVWITRSEEQRVEELINDSLSTLDQTRTISTRAEIYTLSRTVKHTEISAPSLSLAVSWQPWKRLMLAAQTDYLLGSEYAYTGFSPGGADEGATQRSGFETLTPVQKKYTIEKNSVVNFSGGADFRVMKGYTVAMGGYTDFSQGPHDSRPASWDRNIDYYGGTLSLGMDKDLTESRFGISAAYGDATITHFQWTTTSGGQPTLLRNSGGGIVRLRQNFKAFNFGLFLSSTLKI
jgi:hypothetical protein